MEQTAQLGTIRPLVTTSALEQWQNAGKWFNYGDHAIFSRIDGEGDALLMLHGYPTASWDWHRVWPYATARYHVMASDLIGLGFSDKPVNYHYSINDQADLQQGWLEQMRVKQVHLLAHDYGVSIAQELLAREQEGLLSFRIASVVFLNGALFPEMHQPLLIQKLLASPLGGLVSRGITRQVFDFSMSKLFGPGTQPSKQDLDEFWQLNTYNNGRGVTHKLLRYMEERRCHRHRWVGALQQARQPLRMICGVADPVSGQVMAQRYADMMPQADLVRLDGVGHYPHLETPALLWRHYQQFRDGL